MKRTKVLLVAMCVFATAFGSGAATYAQLSDTETATVSAGAGAFDLCAAGETITYEFSRSSDELEHVSGPDIVTFSNYDYSTFFGDPRAVDAVDFVSTEPFQSVQFRSRFGRTARRTFSPPATQGRLDAGGSFFDAFVEITFTCAEGDGTRRAAAPRSVSLSGASNSSAESGGSNATESNETTVPTTENRTATPENSSSSSTETSSTTEPTETTTSTPTATLTPTETPTSATTETPTVTGTPNTTLTVTTETSTETRKSTTTSETVTPTTRAPSSPTETPVAVSHSTTESTDNTTAVATTNDSLV